MRDPGADPSSPPARCCPQARGCQLLRRQLLRRSLALPLAPLLLGSAATSRGASLPDVPDGPGSSSARDRLAESAAAHGLAAWLGLHDINAGFSQLWLPASGWRPASADAAGSVQLRLLPASGVAALQPAAAGSAEAMRLLLLGPLAVHGIAGAVNWGPPDTLDDRRCDQLLLAWPGAAGAGAGNRLALFIDRDEGLLRRLRLARKLALAEVASAVGISLGFLSAMERSQMSASVATLRKLARFYKTNILDFFDPAASNPHLVSTRERKLLDAGQGIKMELLAWGNTVMEPHLFRIAPQAGSGEAYTHEGEEFLHVLKGALAISLQETNYILRAGDSFYFDSSTPHSWANPGKTETCVLWINTPPTF